MTIRPMGAELFHADRRTDGRTDMTKLIVAFCNFANAPKKKIWNSMKNYSTRIHTTILFTNTLYFWPYNFTFMPK